MTWVSFEIAKAIKEAGYPQWNVDGAADNFKLAYDCEGVLWEIKYFDQNPQDYYTAPAYLDVWLWLWREKDIHIDVDNDCFGDGCTSFNDKTFEEHNANDPEEAVITAIEYLVKHNLIK